MTRTAFTRIAAGAFALPFVLAGGRTASAQPIDPPSVATPAPAPPPALPALPALPELPELPLPALPPSIEFEYAIARQKGPRPAPVPSPTPKGASRSSAEELYNQARQLIDQARYDRALGYLDRVAAMTNSMRADAAMYWKAYAQWKLDRRADALATLADMRKRFADSRWAKDAQALDVEIRQASGQSVSPDGQASEELKLLALRGLMNSDPDRAIPMIEQLLAGPSTVKVKENALFVLSQSRSERAREIVASAAKGSVNPDVQLRAVRYLGAIGGTESRQVLDEVYRSTTDLAVKRAVLRSLGARMDRQRLLALAKSEGAPELRSEAVRSLGATGAAAELDELYRLEASPDVKEQIIRAMVATGSIASLTRLASSENEPRLRRTAIQNLGAMGSAKTGDTLRSIYTSDSNAEVKAQVIEALAIQGNAIVLVALAKAEKDSALKRRMVERLSTMDAKEATDYMVELLK